VKSPRNLAAPPAQRSAETTVSCDVVGYSALRVTPEMVPALRQGPGPPGGPALPVSFLKHADEQTVAGLAAVFQAVHRHGLSDTCFTFWGILAAPRFLGRTSLAVALHRFRLEGAWGISPHLIPHHSLHSISGTVSQALGVHGPNFGIGGGPHAADEAFLVAAALLAGDQVPGVWVVLTGFDPEPSPEDPGRAPAAAPGHPGAVPVCGAVALALVAARPVSPNLKLHIAPGPVAGGTRLNGYCQGAPPFSLEALVETLAAEPAGAWQLHSGGRLELRRPTAGAEN